MEESKKTVEQIQEESILLHAERVLNSALANHLTSSDLRYSFECADSAFVTDSQAMRDSIIKRIAEHKFNIKRAEIEVHRSKQDTGMLEVTVHAWLNKRIPGKKTSDELVKLLERK